MFSLDTVCRHHCRSFQEHLASRSCPRVEPQPLMIEWPQFVHAFDAQPLGVGGQTLKFLT